MNKHLSDHQLLAYLEGTAQSQIGRRDSTAQESAAAHSDGAPPPIGPRHSDGAPLPIKPRHSDGALDKHRAQVEAHLSVCPACRARLERLARTAADLRATLCTVGQQVPANPASSWDAVALRWKGERPRRSGPLFYARLRHVATLAVVAIAVVGLAGLIHTFAVTGPPSAKATPSPSPRPPASPSAAPGPLPRPHPDSLAGPISVLILGADGEPDRPRSTSAASADVDRASAASVEIDMLMLLYLDAETQRAFLLSVPQELYVTLPDHGQVCAGSIYGVGQRDEDTNGLALARDAISDTLGLPIQHTALVRFSGFVALVDAVGGVDVEVPHPIEDPAFPDGDGGHVLFSVPAGAQHFEGAMALRYARTRVVPAPGFDRTFRQRQLVLAAHERVTRLGLLPDLIAQAPTLWSSVAGGLETDLSLSDVIDLALLAADLSADDVTAAALDECCVVSYTTPAGEYVLLPQEEEIKGLMEHLLEGKPK